MTESSRSKTLEMMARAIEDTNVNFSLRLVRLVDGEATYELQFADEEPLSFSSNEEAYVVLAERKRRAQAEAALTAYESHLQAEGMAVVPGWQPIETAPRDGTLVLTNCRGFQGLTTLPYEPALVRWVEYKGEGRWCPDPETFTEQDHFDEYWSSTRYDPEVWQPVPAPPASPYGKAVVKEKDDE